MGVFLFSLTAGSYDISLSSAIKTLFNPNDLSDISMIVDLRFQKTILAIVVGGALAISGCVFQAILKNPLAEPFTLGISGGASLGAAIIFCTPLVSLAYFFAPIGAFGGALAAVIFVYILSAKKLFDKNSIILAGIIISFLFSSATVLLFAISKPNQMQASFLWLSGNFNAPFEFANLIICAAIVFLCLILIVFSNIINILSMPSDKISSLGLNTKAFIKFFFIISSIIAALCVCLCGVIGFVGLMIPHILKKIFKSNFSILMPACFLGGAFFLSFCEVLSRIIFAPINIPIAVITNFIGAIFFIFLLAEKND